MISCLMICAAASLSVAEPNVAAPAVALAMPSRDPMAVDLTADPILRVGRESGAYGAFAMLVGDAVRRHPALGEAKATSDEARAARNEAVARLFPSIDLSLSGYRVVARDFSNDPNNIIERSRASRRTDAVLSVQQSIFDFGASDSRIDAAGARLKAASAEMESSADRLALRAIAAWYDVYTYRALVAVGESFTAGQRQFAVAIDERVKQGLSAPGDVARVESYVASAETHVARSRRALAEAEARFTEVFGVAPPAGLQRAPLSMAPAISRDAAEAAAAIIPAVRSATAQSDAAKQDARAVRVDMLPTVTAGIDAGRYGVFENGNDYDIRARVTLRQRFFGGLDSRADQAEARARAVDAHALGVREEARRDAAIAWSDVQALEEQNRALERAYVAARRSRDVLAERFRVSRGTLFDVLSSEDNYFETAVAYVQGVTELDAARYVLLSRTGRLLDALAISPMENGQ